MTEADLNDLARAQELLESPGFIIRLTSLLGTPLEKGLKMLPAKASGAITTAVQKSLEFALKVALNSMAKGKSESFPKLHKTAVFLTGALGGAFGLLGAAAELPVTTGIMLRSIADIARAEGEDLNTLAARLACLEVLALGGKSHSDDGADFGYFAVRVALAREISKAAEYIAAKGLTEVEGPAVVRGMATLIARFGIQVEEKLLAEAAPVFGAIAGAGINLAFIDHFQDMALGHFTIRRLERAYGQETVRAVYDDLLRIRKSQS